MKNRSIPLCIILSIVTCGIYMLYWFVVLTDDLNYASGRDLEEIDPVVREALRFVPAETVDTVLAEALLRTEIMDNREETKSETEGIVTAFVPPEPAVKDSSLRQ